MSDLFTKLVRVAFDAGMTIGKRKETERGMDILYLMSSMEENQTLCAELFGKRFRILCLGGREGGLK